jgi:hypothetical protein
LDKALEAVLSIPPTTLAGVADLLDYVSRGDDANKCELRPIFENALDGGHNPSASKLFALRDALDWITSSAVARRAKFLKAAARLQGEHEKFGGSRQLHFTGVGFVPQQGDIERTFDLCPSVFHSSESGRIGYGAAAGKTGAGETSIVAALTGDLYAEVGEGSTPAREPPPTTTSRPKLRCFGFSIPAASSRPRTSPGARGSHLAAAGTGAVPIPLAGVGGLASTLR